MFTFFKNKIARLTMVSVLMSTPTLLFAATPKLENWLTSATLVAFLKKILESVVELAVMVLVVMIVWVGYLFVSAQGNEKQLEEAKGAFVWLIIGGAIILGAWAITQLVVNTIGSVS